MRKPVVVDEYGDDMLPYTLADRLETEDTSNTTNITEQNYNLVYKSLRSEEFYDNSDKVVKLVDFMKDNITNLNKELETIYMYINHYMGSGGKKTLKN